MSENTATANRFIDRFLEHDLDACLACFAPDAKVHWNGQALDLMSYRSVGQMYISAMFDIGYELSEQFESCGKVVTRGIWTGTHTGSMLSIPATGRSFRVAEVVIDQLENALIVDRWTINDQFGLMQQLGVIPAMK